MITRIDCINKFKEYVGTISEFNHSITITNNNRLIKHYTNGDIYCDKIVKCYITFDYMQQHIESAELTYSIIGGAFGSCSNINQLDSALNELQFKKVNNQQLTIFDLFI